MRSREEDNGFTLVELLVSVVVMSILMGALVAVTAVSFNVTRQSEDRVLGTRSAQLSSLYFTADAQSASSFLIGAPVGCAPSGPSTFVIGMQLQGARAAYFTQDVAGSRTLLRVRCAGSSSQVTALARYLDPGHGLQPDCGGSPCASTSRAVAVEVKAKDHTFSLQGTRRTTA